MSKRNFNTGILQRQEDNEEDELVQTKQKARETQQVTPAFESRINSLKSGGQSLDKETRNFFELRFGKDFSGVRIHQNGQAADVSRSINARAFTLGNNVVFGSGQYQPHSSEGKRLLGHELTHVVQQASNGFYTNSMIPLVVQRECRHFPEHTDPDTYCQTEAEAVDRIANACPPNRDDFLYRDGPEGYPWRPIPGYGCAHYVAHHLGITEGPAHANCRGGFSVTITQLITGRTEHTITDAQINDIWVTASRGHCGYVTAVDPARGVRSRECYIEGGTGHRWHLDGSVFR